jgi:hypothetical protein
MGQTDANSGLDHSGIDRENERSSPPVAPGQACSIAVRSVVSSNAVVCESYEAQDDVTRRQCAQSRKNGTLLYKRHDRIHRMGAINRHVTMRIQYGLLDAVAESFANNTILHDPAHDRLCLRFGNLMMLCGPRPIGRRANVIRIN